MDWQEEVNKKTISADDAANLVKSGDLVSIPMGREPYTILYSLAARKEELKGVRIRPGMQARDYGYYDPGWEDSFLIDNVYVMPPTYELYRQKRAEYLVSDLRVYPDEQSYVDVLLVTVSPPNKNGYCSFGGSVWVKKKEAERARVVIAEINPYQIRTYGDNFIHVSEIDHFVEHVPIEMPKVTRDMTGRAIAPPSPRQKAIAEHISSLIEDGDTLQIGIGQATEFLEQFGAFEGKKDLGVHSEIIPAGLIHGVQKGIINGSRKTVNKGVAVGTGIGGGPEEYSFCEDNPQFALYSSDYVINPITIAAHDNMNSINSALAVDLTGQIAVESIGFRMMAGSGGQLAFAIGAQMSRGGKYIVAMMSTTERGESRIQSAFPPGTIVTIPRTLAHYVVTEYGIANLRAKTQRQRALEMISVAHPDFRAQLKKDAENAWWPD